MRQILVIGSTVADVVIQVERLPRQAEDVIIRHQEMFLGGCAFNVAAFLHSAGSPYSLISPVGGGIYGDFVRREMGKRGMPILVDLAAGENGCCYCLVDPQGERSFMAHHDVEYTFDPAWLAAMDLSPVASAYVCGLELEERDGHAILDFLAKHPAWSIYCAPSPRVLHIPQDRMAKLWALRPIMHMNEAELLAMTQAPSVEEGAALIHGRTGQAVIVTLGARGACCYSGEGLVHVPGFQAPVKNTIGAGDTHLAAVMAARNRGFSWERALYVANQAAAWVVGVEGGNLPTQFQDRIKELFNDETPKEK